MSDTVRKLQQNNNTLTLRLEKTERSDKCDYSELTTALWHAITEEAKGKSKRLVVSNRGRSTPHRIHYQHGTDRDNYVEALNHVIYADWKKKREQQWMPCKLSLRRFVEGKCFCVRRANRKFAVCWRHHHMTEYLQALVRDAPKWHANAEDAECRCNESCVLTTTSFGDLGRTLLCGLIETPLQLNAEAGISHVNWKYECVTGTVF